jgi:hypothetical protein
MNLFQFELYKIFSKKSVWFSLLGFLALFILPYSGQYKYGWDSYNNVEFQSMGREVAKAHEGVITKSDEEQATILLDEYNKNSFTIVKEEEKELEAKKRWEVNIAERFVMVGSSEVIEMKMDALKENGEGLKGADLKKNNLHIDMLKKRDEPYYSYSNGWNGMIDYVNTFGLISLAVLIILGLSSVFSGEDETGMNQYILSSKHGRRKLVSAKISASSVYVVFVAFVLYIEAFVHHAYLYTLEGGQGSLQLAFKYIASPYNFTLMEYHLVQLAFYLCSAIAFAMFVLLVSSLIRNSLISFFVSGVIFGLPLFVLKILSLKQEWILDLFAFSFVSLMGVEELFMNFKAFSVFGNVFTYFLLASLYLGIVFIFTLFMLYTTNKRKQLV